MINNSTNINRTKNHLSPEVVEQKKKQNTTLDIHILACIGTGIKMWLVMMVS
jgi:hypothetical protein